MPSERPPTSSERRSTCHPHRKHRARGLCTVCLSNEQRKRLREQVLEILGGRCTRCGITHPLAVDHKDDDGNIDRSSRRLSVKQKNYRDIIHGRTDRFQLLCHNCNFLKSFDRETYDKEPTWAPR